MICKSEFLDSEHVKGFLDFLASYVCKGNEFAHKYTGKRTKKEWSCESLTNAYQQYCYPLVSVFHEMLKREDNHRGYEANKKVLDALKMDLQASYLKPDEEKLLETSLKVFIWGGVAGPRNEESKRKGNYLWLKGRHPDGKELVCRYKAAHDVFNCASPCLDDVGKEGIRSNAGFTKIYSLLFEDFIIYDSRVAATLGLFVIKYCRQKKLKEIPRELDFAWMPHHGEDTLRNANVGDLKFGTTTNSERIHASSNIRANWLFTKLFNDDDARCNFPTEDNDCKANKLRALEAAFFMIGYDLTGHPWLDHGRIKDT